MPELTGLLLLTVVLALLFDFSNGWHDCANAVATVVSTRVLSPLGTTVGGWRIIRTLGMKMVKLEPVHGFAAETGAATVLLFTAHFGLPVSTTHTITSSILGVGSTKRLSAVRWGLTHKIISAWIFTLPGAGLLGAGVYALLVSLT